MKRGLLTSLAVLASWGIVANFAAAQWMNQGVFQTPLQQRSFRPGDRAIAAWQQNVMRLNQDGSLQGQLTQTNQAGGTVVGLQTGHQATFFNYSHYYPIVPTTGAGIGGQGSNNFGAGLGTGLGMNPNLGYGLNPAGTGFGGMPNNPFLPGSVTPFYRP